MQNQFFKTRFFRAGKQLTVLLIAAVVFLSACSPVDKEYGVGPDDSELETTESETVTLPTIRSEDKLMPIFFDISQYDEENYADIYLGKKYELQFTYGGTELTVPMSFKEMNAKGWEIDSELLSPDSTLLSGETVEAEFVNKYQKRLKAVLFNAGNASARLQKCNIVKLIVPENVLLNGESSYDQFWLNGVTNFSAITDIVEYLGAPSHFYAESESGYYFDYFLTKEDKRNRITVYLDVNEDSITSIEIAKYKK